MFTVGFTASALNATRFTVDSTRPGDVGRLELHEVIAGREPGQRAVYVCQVASPSILYEM